MISKVSANYEAHWKWLMDVVGGTDLVLCRTSALEYLGLFAGWSNEKTIYVYAKQKGEYENIDYHVVNTFEDIDVVQEYGNVLCTSLNQTINDMLADLYNIDEQPLVEALSDYYYMHKESFDGLIIKPENIDSFNSIKDWAIEYHEVG
jgi:hypothetical protein